MLDLALESGRSPLSLLDEEHPDSWSILDLEIVSQWRHFKEVKCPGCGRPLSQHLWNRQLHREETPDDYIPYSIDCPAQQAISAGQEMWKTVNKAAIERYRKDDGPDPGMGIYWVAQGHSESLPQPDPDD